MGRDNSETVYQHDQPIDIAVSMASLAEAKPTAGDAPGRPENITSLRTWAISPCCASIAILLLQDNPVRKYIIRYSKNNEPVFDTLRKLVRIFFLFLFFLLNKVMYDAVVTITRNIPSRELTASRPSLVRELWYLVRLIGLSLASDEGPQVVRLRMPGSEMRL